VGGAKEDNTNSGGCEVLKWAILDVGAHESLSRDELSLNTTAFTSDSHLLNYNPTKAMPNKDQGTVS
jgi:hypothetical protein